ncbi:MAG: twin-arginine translocase subunit TatC, partial [Bacteroidales bacterium]|nr:twin-arginine translocase subunit TatC [Bacteroidales bacterium]
MSKNEQSEMSFWDHLDVLRSLIFKMLILVVAMMCLFFVLMPDIFDSVILAPCRGDFPLYTLFASITQQFPSLPQFNAEGWEVKLINIQLASQFFIHMSTSFWLGLIFSFPAVLYLMWKFVKPALYARERLGVKLAFSLGVLMFDIGLAVGYFVVVPVTLRFLAAYQVSAMMPNQISLDSYMDTFLLLLFVMGLVFE